MQSKYTLIICLIFASTSVFAQDANLFDARSLGLSGSNVTASNTWSGMNNPAGLGMHSAFHLGLSYNNRYMVPEMGTQAVVANIPAGPGTLSSSFIYFGAKQYHESHMVLAYGKTLAKWLSMGINFAYHSQSVEAIKKRASAITGEIGLIAIPAKGLEIGLNIKNPTQSAYGRLKGEGLSSGMQTGISLSEDKNYVVAAQINWNEFRDFTFIMAAECFIVKYLFIRVGMKFPVSQSFSFGLGTNFQRFSMDLGFEQHSVLGLSSALSISYKIRGND